jgi:uncharacterized protein YfaS (alpha-2-macroglobulin family)
LSRPDGLVVGSAVAQSQSGGVHFAFDLPLIAPAGDWRLDISRDDDNEPVGVAAVHVLPPDAQLLAIGLSVDAAVIDPAQPGTVTIDVEDAHGAPAANAPGELDVAVAAADEPFPAFHAFAFGLEDDRIAPVKIEPIHFVTDASGKASVALKLPQLPASTRLLEARITAHVLDPAGRSAERTIAQPLGDRAVLLGVKPVDTPAFSEGQPVRFDAIAVSPDGARQDKPAAGWEILRRDAVPFWGWTGTRFTYRPRLDEAHVAGGQIDIAAGTPSQISTTAPPGNYRIALFDPNGDSSVGFSVGWVGSGGEDADAVQIKLAKPFVTPGETADIFVKPPFDSDIVLMGAGPALGEAVVRHIPAAGSTVKLDIPRDSVDGVEVIASAVTPAGANGAPPQRALGKAWLQADPALRRLPVALDLPERISPRQELAIPITVSGALDEPAVVSVSVVEAASEPGEDAASAALGEPASPAIALRDVYDRIIGPLGSVPREARAAQQAPLREDDRPFLSPPSGGALSLSSGIVALDKSGRGTVRVLLPDFQGAIRVRAIAWTASRIGVAEAQLPVHDPLSASLDMPDTLAPDDRAELSLALDNIDGPRGEYHLKVDASGAVAIQGDAQLVANLAEHEQRSQPLTLIARGVGDGAVTVRVEGPGGMAYERSFATRVRPGGPIVSRYGAAVLKPGGALAADPSLFAGLRTDTIAASLTLAGVSAFDPGAVSAQLLATPAVSVVQIIADATPAIGDPAQRGRMDAAIVALAALQRRDGGFGPAGAAESDLLLSARAAEFLSQTNRSAAAAPALAAVLDYLARQHEPQPGADQPPPDPSTIPDRMIEALAYRDKVLSEAGRFDLHRLRYFVDRFGPVIRSPAALAHIGAAFAALGAKNDAAAAFTRASALPLPADPDAPGVEFRSLAELAAIMAESNAAPPAALQSVAAKLAAAAAARREFGIDEAIWLYRARAVLAPAGAVKLKLADRTVEQAGPFTIALKSADLPPVRNAGDAPIHAGFAVSGALLPGEPKDGAGFEIQRWLFDLTGKPIDPAAMRLNDRLVIVLTGRFTGQGQPHAMVTDRLAGGWRIEAASLTDPATRFPWLKELTGSGWATLRQGAFVASPLIGGERREFKLAYVVRAATPGQFTLPGAYIADINQPGLSARSPAGRIKIDPS